MFLHLDIEDQDDLVEIMANAPLNANFLGLGSFHVKSPRNCRVTSQILTKLVFVVPVVLITHSNF